MKKIVCEICGSTSFIKKDGLFVCQNCGMGFTREDINGMLQDVDDSPVAAEVSVGEPVVISSDESSESLKKTRRYISLAVEELSAGNLESSKSYVNKILEDDDKNHFGWFLNAQLALLSIKELDNMVDKLTTVERNLNKAITNVPLSDAQYVNSFCNTVGNLHNTAYQACGRLVLDAAYNMADIQQCMETLGALAKKKKEIAVQLQGTMILRLKTELNIEDAEIEKLVEFTKGLNNDFIYVFPIDAYKSTVESFKERTAIAMNQYVDNVMKGNSPEIGIDRVTDVQNQFIRCVLLGGLTLDDAMAVCALEYGKDKILEYDKSLNTSVMPLLEDTIKTFDKDIKSRRSKIETRLADIYKAEHPEEIKAEQEKAKEYRKQISELESKKAELQSYRSDPGLLEAIKNYNTSANKTKKKRSEITLLEFDLDGLGIFKSKEKAKLKERIVQAKSDLTSLEKEEEKYSAIKTNIENGLKKEAEEKQTEINREIIRLENQIEKTEEFGFDPTTLVEDEIERKRTEFDQYSSHAGHYDIYKDIDLINAPIKTQYIQVVPNQLTNDAQNTKKASVVKNAILGSVIAGPTGAVIGALHAVNKNINS